MKYLLALVLILPMGLSKITYDFGEDCEKCNEWFVVVDGVMGGLSTAKLKKTTNSYILSGKVSLENNGGFASMRTPYQEYDLSGYNEVTVRYRSTGQDFGLTLNKHQRFWYPNYKVNLPITYGEWKEITYTLKEFKRYRLGRELSGNPDANDLSKIIRLGFISNTKAATSYTFEVDYIKFY